VQKVWERTTNLADWLRAQHPFFMLLHTGNSAPIVSTATPEQPAGYYLRMVKAADLSIFAAENVPDINDSDLLPGTAAVDWEKPKASLLSHAGVEKYIHVLASVAATSQAFELRTFERLFFGKYTAECEQEISQTTDTTRKQRLAINLRVAIRHHDDTPACRAELVSYAKIHRGNIEFTVTNLIKFCRHIVAEWLEMIPAARVRELLAELDRLTGAPLTARLAFFGLADFAPAGDLPKEESL
jgi:hypothetical protein